MMITRQSMACGSSHGRLPAFRLCDSIHLILYLGQYYCSSLCKVASHCYMFDHWIWQASKHTVQSFAAYDQKVW